MTNTPTNPTTEDQIAPWQWLSQRVDFATYCPKADPSVIAERIQEGGSVYYVLKHPTFRTYLRLSEADYNLWQSMDGTKNLKALVIAYFVAHKTFAYGRIGALVDELKENYFLLDKPVGVYKQVAQLLEKEDWRHRWRRLAQAFIEHQFPISGLDHYLAAIYKAGGWLFFNPLWLWGVLVVALVGLWPFSLLLRASEPFPILGLYGGNDVWGFLLLLLAYIIVVFLHELAHALTTKHYGRQVPRGGAMIYFGMPAFYVDTMDIWLEPRKHRLAVTWMGPYSGLFLGGLCSLLALFLFPSAPILAQFFFKMAFLGYAGFIINLNPLIELDGYFILIDALNIPVLRDRALAFIKTELPGKLKTFWSTPRANAKVESGETDSPRNLAFDREEMIFTVYGVAAAIYAIYIVWFTLFLWQSRLSDLFGTLWNQGGLSRILVMLIALVVLVPAGLAIGITVWGWLTKAFEWLQDREFFDRERNIAVLSFLGLLSLIGLPWLFNNAQTTVLYLWLVVIAVGSIWALLVTARQYVGSEIQPKFWALALSAILMLGGALAAPLADPDIILIWTRLAALPLPLVGLTVLLGMDLRQSSPLEKAMMSLLLVGGFIAAFVTVRSLTNPSFLQTLLAGGAIFFWAVFLATMIPIVLSYLNTRFIIPLLLLVVGAIGLGFINAFGPEMTIPELNGSLLITLSLWAVGGFTYAAAGWRIHFPVKPLPQGLVMSEEHLLQDAFSRFFEALFAGFQSVFGERRAQVVDDDLDVISIRADWGVEIEGGYIRDKLDLSQTTVLDQAARYGEVLDRAIDLMDNWSGSIFITRAAQAAYDSLPWPERESLGRYVLQNTDWGGTIASQFASERGAHFQLLRSLPIFAGSSQEDLDQILARAHQRTIPMGRVLLKQGKPYPYFAIILAGEFEVWKADESTRHSVLVGEMKRGSTFGSQIFAAGTEAIAQGTYRASVPTDLLIIRKDVAHKLLAAGLLPDKETTRMSSTCQMLAEMPIFADLSPQQIEALFDQMKPQTVQQGQTIVEQGETRHHFFIIESGEVEVHIAANNRPARLVARLGQGEHFGETALYTDRPYGATCIAKTEVNLLLLDEFIFDRLVATTRHMTHYVEQVSSGRLKDNRRKLGFKTPTWSFNLETGERP